MTVKGECQPNDGPIENCCCLGYNNSKNNVRGSGVYTIANFCGVQYSNTRVYCDTSSGGGGWTVIQRRKDGNIEFRQRFWIEYEDGFGNLYDEYCMDWAKINALPDKSRSMGTSN